MPALTCERCSQHIRAHVRAVLDLPLDYTRKKRVKLPKEHLRSPRTRLKYVDWPTLMYACECSEWRPGGLHIYPLGWPRTLFEL